MYKRDVIFDLFLCMLMFFGPENGRGHSLRFKKRVYCPYLFINKILI